MERYIQSMLGDALHRLVRDQRKAGAQYLLAFHQRVECLLKSRSIQGAIQLNIVRGVIKAIVRVKTVQKPEPSLGVRNRIMLTLRKPRDARAGRGRPVRKRGNCAGLRFQSSIGKDNLERNIDSQTLRKT